jgi:solute carrier family 25 citrate transporter 1
MIAGFCDATAIITPMETIKVKLIHDKFRPNPQYRNLFNGINTIVQKEGFSGIYKGYLATVLKQVTNQGIRFLLFEKVDNALSSTAIKDHKFLRNIGAGSVAGFCSVLVNQPIDVVKTVMQGLEAHKYKGIGDVIKAIAMKEGLVGFYKGVGPRLVRACMDAALTFSFFHLVRRTFIRFYEKP